MHVLPERPHSGCWLHTAVVSQSVSPGSYFFAHYDNFESGGDKKVEVQKTKMKLINGKLRANLSHYCKKLSFDLGN